MPNANFQPVIGDSFGDVMRQQAHYVDVNRATDEANLARAAAADQTRNSYFQTIAQMQQGSADRQTQAQSDATREATANRWAQYQSDLQQKQFEEQRADQKTGVKETLKFQREQLAAQEKAAASKQKHDEFVFNQKVENFGQNYAKAYAGLNFDHELAQKTLDSMDEKIQELTDVNAKIQAKKASKRSPGEEADAIRIPQTLVTLAKQRALADRNLQTVARKLAQHEVNIGNNGFEIRDDKLVHILTGKEFDFKQAVKEAKQAGSTDMTSPDEGNVSVDIPPWVSSGAAPMGDTSLGASGIAFAQPDEGTAAAAPAAPMKIGRFSVTPR